MSEEIELKFEQIDMKAQREKTSLNYYGRVIGVVDGKETTPLFETWFMEHKLSRFPPAKIIKDKKEIIVQRDSISFPIFDDQPSCLDLEKQINYCDECLAQNKNVIFSGKHAESYSFPKSIKLPDEDDKQRYVKLRLKMSWNYSYNGVFLDEDNANVVKKVFFDAKKVGRDPTNETVTLSLPNEDGDIENKTVKFSDIQQTKDKIMTKVYYRNPLNISENAKPIKDCNEKELIKYYGKSELVTVNTPDDFTKYYRSGCFIRVAYKPSRIYAQKTGDKGLRKCAMIYEMEVVDIINCNNTSAGRESMYNNYAFGKRNVNDNDDVSEKQNFQTNTHLSDSDSSDTEQVDNSKVIQDPTSEPELEIKHEPEPTNDDSDQEPKSDSEKVVHSKRNTKKVIEPINDDSDQEPKSDSDDAVDLKKYKKKAPESKTKNTRKK